MTELADNYGIGIRGLDPPPSIAEPPPLANLWTGYCTVEIANLARE